MTVAQLIERLQQMPQDANVVIQVDEPYDTNACTLREDATDVDRNANGNVTIR